MYFFDTKQLAQELRQGKVTEHEQMRYFFWTTVLGGGYAGWSWGLRGSDVDVAAVIGALTTLALIVIGLLACYRVNREGDDRDFVIRFICLGWTVNWRVGVAGLLSFPFVFGVIYLIWAVFTKGEWMGSQWFVPFATGYGLVLTTAEFVLIRRSLIVVSSAEAHTTPSADIPVMASQGVSAES